MVLKMNYKKLVRDAMGKKILKLIGDGKKPTHGSSVDELNSIVESVYKEFESEGTHDMIIVKAECEAVKLSYGEFKSKHGGLKDMGVEIARSMYDISKKYGYEFLFASNEKGEKGIWLNIDENNGIELEHYLKSISNSMEKVIKIKNLEEMLLKKAMGDTCEKT